MTALLTYKEASRELAISVSTLKRRIAAGLLDISQVGQNERSRRVTSISIQKYLDLTTTDRLCTHN